MYETMNPLSSKKSGRDELLKFALITDLHVDYGYLEGMSNDCGLPACCRADSGPPKIQAESSGKWGDFK